MINLNKVLQYLKKFGPAIKLVEDVEFLIDAIKKNPLKYRANVIGTLAYLLYPIDAISDMIQLQD